MNADEEGLRRFLANNRELRKVRAMVQELQRQSNEQLIEKNRRLYHLKRWARQQAKILLERVSPKS